MSDPAYDGLCGRPCPCQLPGGGYLRCRLTLAHAGACDWEGKRIGLEIFGGLRREDAVLHAKRGSVAARAMLGMPLDCSCTPLFGDGWEIVDYLFDGECEAHTPPSRERKR